MPEQQSPENVLAAMEQLNAREGEQELTQGFEQTYKMVGKAAKALGLVK
jgi:hypothetical protein